VVGIRRDESRWPIVVFHYPKDYSERDVAEHIADMTRLLRGNQPCGVIFHLTGARAFNANERAMFARFIKQYSTWLTRVCVASSLVTTSALHHGVLTAVSWVVPMPCDVKVHSQFDDALNWVSAKLAGRGLGVRSA